MCLHKLHQGRSYYASPVVKPVNLIRHQQAPAIDVVRIQNNYFLIAKSLRSSMSHACGYVKHQMWH